MPVRIDEIVIDDEFSKLMPPISSEERTQLLLSIERDGRYRDKLIVWQEFSILLDGHHRYELYQAHHADDSISPPEIEELSFPSRDAAKKWVVRNQLARRNLSDFDRTRLALLLEPEIKAKAKANQQAAGGALPAKAPEPVSTRKEVAAIAGVGEKQVAKVKAIVEHAPPAVVDAVSKGDISVHKAHQSIAGVKPPKAKPEPTAREPVYGPGVLPKSFSELVEKIVRKWPSEKLRDFGEQVKDVCKLAVEKERMRRGQ